MKRHATRGWSVFLVQSAAGHQMIVGVAQEQRSGSGRSGKLASRTTTPWTSVTPSCRWLIWLATRGATEGANLFDLHTDRRLWPGVLHTLQYAEGCDWRTEQDDVAVVQPGGYDIASHCLSEVVGQQTAQMYR